MIRAVCFAQQNDSDPGITIIEPLNALNSGQSEYAPFFWKNKLYFISNRNNHFALYLSEKISRNALSTVFRPEKEPGTYSIPQHLAHKINAKYNEGPFCFVESGIYITCNQYNRSFSGNPPLEIRYSAYDEEKGFTEAKRIPIDMPDSVPFGHPAIINDTMMIFSSIINTGQGKTDLYYSIKKNKKWLKPVNISNINSSEDELFANYNNGYLYFSSNRAGGYGQLDVYRVKVNGRQFSSPELLKTPINSASDDFGLWVDPTLRWGYFTSNRSNTFDDIYWFSFAPPLFDECKPFVKPNYCFLFYEESGIESKDTLGMYYEWSFGDGEKSRGLEVRHCFPGPGKYEVALNIVDKSSGAVFYNQVSYEFVIEGGRTLAFDVPDTIVAQKPIVFKSQFYSPSKVVGKVAFNWDFGDRNNSNKGFTPHSYEEPGKYMVKLSVVEVKSDSVIKLCVEKPLVVVSAADYPLLTKNTNSSSKEILSLSNKTNSVLTSDTIVSSSDKANEKTPNWKYNPLYKINEEDSSYSYKVHLGVSPNLISPKDTAFKGLSPISYNKINDLYHYSFGNVHSLVESKPLYDEAHKKGFENAIVVAFKGDSLIFGSNMQNIFNLIGDSVKRKSDLDTLKKLSLIIFFSNGKHTLSEEAQKQLDKLVEKIKNKYVKNIQVVGHTDDIGSSELNDKISLQRAESVTNFFIHKGIDKTLIHTTYKGDKQPLFPDKSAKNSDYNRRVEIEIFF